ncbi:hypothetical protein JTB14_007953 [Gonioctena quinquepunctata]|nr:hypothetical protein JTB14_007953 [Gonioctena quinquepunctata]
MPSLVIIAAIVAFEIHAANPQTVQTTFLCPENFHPVGKKCYFFSTQKAIWSDSHYNCQVLNSTLSVINSYREQNLLKDFIGCGNNTKLENSERWIDGIYNWIEQKWKWGSSGNPITFNAFSKNHVGDEYKWKCIALNGDKHNKWTARKCTEKKGFICETETNVMVQFKLYHKKNKKFDLAKCSSGEVLEKREKKKCMKMLGSVGNNPGNYVASRFEGYCSCVNRLGSTKNKSDGLEFLMNNHDMEITKN